VLLDALQLSLETSLSLIAPRNDFRENASLSERGLRLSVLLPGGQEWGMRALLCPRPGPSFLISTRRKAAALFPHVIRPGPITRSTFTSYPPA
jgi:hypothetical protein